jgi:maltose/moltooligosaccharide transporter
MQIEKPRLSFWQIWNMSFGFLGIQFGWGLQLANMSAIYTKLGASPDHIPILWLAGPMTGLLVQPIIGWMSDRTWTGLGRRRPYFLLGAILSSLALFFMPQCSALWMAAGLLWILDSSINISMEPFRAFVADKLGSDQRTTGFIMQSFFIGIGATLANLLPTILRHFGVVGNLKSGIPINVMYSFRAGAVAFLLAVVWTILTTPETPPDPKTMPAPKRSSSTVLDIADAVRNMPTVMRWLGAVQIITWLGLFCMWMFFGLSTARHVFGAVDQHSPAFDRGTDWGGVCFAVYSFVCFLVAFALPALAARVGRKSVHAISLTCGGLGLIATAFIHTQYPLLLVMVGVGIAWASILALPYAMLSDSIPQEKTGLYMGLFNFFIVIPEIIASLTFQPLVKNVFGNDPLGVVVLGGVCMLVAATLTTRIPDTIAVRQPEPGPISATGVEVA